MAGMTRTIIYGVLIVFATAVSYLSIRGWRDAILGAGITLLAWLIASRTYERLRRFKPARVSLFDRALVVAEVQPSRPADLEATERLFGWRTYAPDEFDSRIRPFVQRLVARRLFDRHDVDLASEPERAARFLGPQLNEVLIEERQMPSNTEHLSLLVDEIEAI